MPRQPQQSTQVADHVLQPAVARQFLQRVVKNVIHLVIAIDIMAGSVLFEFLVQGGEPLQVLRGCLDGHLMGNPAFQHGHDGENFFQVTWRQFGHEAASSRLDMHEPFRRENFQGFAQRCAADAQIHGEGCLIQSLPRSEGVADDPFFQDIHSLLAQR